MTDVQAARNAFDEGKAAAAEKGHVDNPYAGQGVLATLWRQGYQYGLAERVAAVRARTAARPTRPGTR